MTRCYTMLQQTRAHCLDFVSNLLVVSPINGTFLHCFFPLVLIKSIYSDSASFVSLWRIAFGLLDSSPEIREAVARLLNVLVCSQIEFVRFGPSCPIITKAAVALK